MGHYTEAIEAFEEIINTNPHELGVLMSLAQTHLEQGRSEFSSAFSARAEASWIACLRVILNLMEASPGFRRLAWKLAGDALFSLSQLLSFSDGLVVADIVGKVANILSEHPQNRLEGLVSFPPLLDPESHPNLSLAISEVAKGCLP